MLFRGSLRVKLVAVILLTTLVGVVVALGAMIAYDLRAYHRGWLDDLSTQGELLGRTTTLALEFDDARVARENLSLLRFQPRVRAAAVYTPKGEVFATYSNGESVKPFPSFEATDSVRIEDNEMLMFKKIFDDGRFVGTIFLRARYELRDRVMTYAGIALMVAFFAMLVAFFVSSWLQKIVTRPILGIGEVAREVVAKGDYSRRAEKISTDEVGELANDFNDMLSVIERRTQALAASNLEKANEVEERRVAQQEVMRLNERLEGQLERLTLMDQITRAIGERQDLQSIYQVAIRSIEDSLPVDFCCICRYDPTEGGGLTVIRIGAHSQPFAMDLALNEQSVIDVDQNILSRFVTGELVYEPDIQASSLAFPKRLARSGLRSLVMAPLESEGRVLGILVAARQMLHSFSSGDCEFLSQVSAHVALAGRQAELHESLQQAYDDLRQTQQAVMQQERLRALGQMASGIAHDINNAISPVALYTEALLEREPALSERGRGYLVTISRAIEDVAATVARLREFYRQREPQLVHSSVQLNLLVQQVIDLTRVRWSDMPQQRGIVIRLETELAPDLQEILGVESELREALINLVFNAVDAMPDGGLLKLRTRAIGASERGTDAAEQHSVVEVIDTGVGMDEDTRRRCLEPFFTTKGERGTGLGLAMVYGVVQRHGAEVDIVSAIGQGTTMRLTFPVPVTAPSVQSAVAPAQAPIARLRLLIVDDDPLMLKSLGETLELDGHEVSTANGGQAGIDAFNASHEAFDAVITDLGMPYVDGRKVASTVKLSAEPVPVILLTGWGQRLLADDEIPPYVDRVLSKPPKLRELRQALAELTRSEKLLAAVDSKEES